jgi:hypothetical protein
MFPSVGYLVLCFISMQFDDSTLTAIYLCAQACVGWLMLCVNAQTKVSQLDTAISCQQHVL